MKATHNIQHKLLNDDDDDDDDSENSVITFAAESTIKLYVMTYTPKVLHP